MHAIDASSSSTVAEPFASLTELHREHLALIRAGRTPSQQSHLVEGMRVFLARSQQTWRRLDDRAARYAAQSSLDYWIATLAELPEYSASPPALIVLAPFVPSQADDLTHQESPFKGLNAFRESDASW